MVMSNVAQDRETRTGRKRGTQSPLRLTFVISHPIQYHVPLYRRLARRNDMKIRVFYTWHGGEKEVWDSGFKREIAWDIPLTEGYDYEVVPNKSRHPGTHHFMGLRNSGLFEAVISRRPDAVHITGYPYAGHLVALRSLSKRGIPLLFRGDSHLLDPSPAWKALAKKLILNRLFRYPAAFLYVGKNNRDYYRAYGVPDEKLFYCPHSIELDRFAEPAEEFESQALAWRRSLGIEDDKIVLLFAGKFERKKQPVALMRAFAGMNRNDMILLMVGDGELGDVVRSMAQQYPRLFKVLPFQNQSMMPIVYRLGDIFVLPSSAKETWGLAVNEAMACSRAVLVSDRVGCATDAVNPGVTGEMFGIGNWEDFQKKLSSLVADRSSLKQMGSAARRAASKFNIQATETGLISALEAICSPWCSSPDQETSE